MMDTPMSIAFKNVPNQVVDDFKQTMGIVFFFNGKEVSPFMCILILVITGIVFYLLAVFKISIKKKN